MWNKISSVYPDFYVVSYSFNSLIIIQYIYFINIILFYCNLYIVVFHNFILTVFYCSYFLLLF